MLGFILRPYLVTLVALAVLTYLIPMITVSHWSVLLIAGLAVMLLFRLIKPILNLFLLPFNIVSLGLIGTLVNLALLWFVTALVPGFQINPVIILGYNLGFWGSLAVTAFLLSWINAVLDTIF